MANQEHHALLVGSVRAFNAWRKENPDILPNLSGANLFNISLFEANLRGANLSNANLRNTDLRGADLTDVIHVGVVSNKTKF